MDNRRNIPAEYAEVRQNMINGFYIRPYLIPIDTRTKLCLDPIDIVNVDFSKTINVERYKYPSGNQDIMISNTELGYLVRNSVSVEGTKPLLDRIIVNADSYSQARRILELFRLVRAGEVDFQEFKSGSYGAVGMNPEGANYRYSDVCVKYFNFAFPFSPERWEKSTKNHDQVGSAWNLSGVTGLGNYFALRILAENGIPVPNTYLGSSEVLIQEFIDGYTVADLFDNYEVLKAKGVLGKDDKIIDRLHDFANEFVPLLAKKVHSIINPIRQQYWSPTFQHYDVNWGNVMIARDKLTTPELGYKVIDPIR